MCIFGLGTLNIAKMQRWSSYRNLGTSYDKEGRGFKEYEYQFLSKKQKIVVRRKFRECRSLSVENLTKVLSIPNLSSSSWQVRFLCEIYMKI